MVSIELEYKGVTQRRWGLQMSLLDKILWVASSFHN